MGRAVIKFNDMRDRMFTNEETGYEDRTFQSVVESALYNSENMFGREAWDAERELLKRLMVLFPPPEWATKHDRT